MFPNKFSYFVCKIITYKSKEFPNFYSMIGISSLCPTVRRFTRMSTRTHTRTHTQHIHLHVPTRNLIIKTIFSNTLILCIRKGSLRVYLKLHVNYINAVAWALIKYTSLWFPLVQAFPSHWGQLYTISICRCRASSGTCITYSSPNLRWRDLCNWYKLDRLASEHPALWTITVVKRGRFGSISC